LQREGVSQAVQKDVDQGNFHWEEGLQYPVPIDEVEDA
jgi:hypothetical protein